MFFKGCVFYFNNLFSYSDKGACHEGIADGLAAYDMNKQGACIHHASSLWRVRVHRPRLRVCPGQINATVRDFSQRERAVRKLKEHHIFAVEKAPDVYKLGGRSMKSDSPQSHQGTKKTAFSSCLRALVVQ